ncbi:hypothetical protein [Heyndrickxia acidicola]|uniref:Uncharacterized protein n=1 Tax=Heyndrickxia acidicola TaxID=209389 RepID=A0ABU6MC08_9BACI|nr:hypothetical protein [Heyndrickxia acidicola]MED1201948.1 hypothetical protein [Heyndrickxia acidicola]
MDANCRFDPKEVYDRKLEEEFSFWLPVMAGIASKEEVSKMTAHQLGVANAAARLKLKLFEGS